MASNTLISIRLSVHSDTGNQVVDVFRICPTNSVKFFKEELPLHVFNPRTHHCTLLSNGRAMSREHCLISDYGVSDGSCVLLILTAKKLTDSEMKMLKPVWGFNQHEARVQNSEIKPTFELVPHGVPSSLFPVVQQFAETTRRGFQLHDPVRITQGGGKGGSYFMSDSSGESYAIFKPADEEPKAKNNPIHQSTEKVGMKLGTSVGGGYLREVAAYILDHPKDSSRGAQRVERFGFSGVPPTCFVRSSHSAYHYCKDAKEKIGSLQMFMSNDEDCGDLGSKYTDCFTAEAVHKIAILDMRFANADRHGGNLLYYKPPEGDLYQLIPIDHGYCFPSEFGDVTFVWVDWKHADTAFEPEIVEHIMSFEAGDDLAILKDNGWEMPQANARVFRTSTMFLKKCVAKGWTAKKIGLQMTRDQDDNKSEIEKVFEEASKFVSLQMGDDVFVQEVGRLIDEHLAQED